ncbi:MAG: hypothetical protein KF729_07365 [Sandaracinaceae bacterium]|nr:hypothetical protein [Sandaracinaceae bacterium]
MRRERAAAAAAAAAEAVATGGAPAAASAGPARGAAYAVIAIAATIAFGRAVPFALLDGWDDDRFLIDDPLVHEVGLDSLVAIFARPHFQAYHPLHLLSYWLDVPWVGADGPVIHAVSLALWVLALFAVYEAGRALRLGPLGALAATLFVGLHPVQVEAVTWATGRKDILALGFAALALIAHLRAERPFDRYRLASLAAFSLAALSKTSALPLPIVLFTAEVLVRGRDWRRAALAVAPSLLVAVGLGALTIAIWSDAEMTRPLEVVPRARLVLATLTHHLETVLLPARVSPLYPIARTDEHALGALLLGPLALGVLAALAWRTRDPHLRFGVIAFVALWLPVSNVIPLYFQWQDRYLSLPIWPLAIAAGAGLDALRRVPGPRWPAPACAALVAGLLAARTAQYAGRWQDAETLFGHAAATHPGEFYAWLNLGHARVRRGELDGGLRAYERALEAANLGLGHDARFRAVLLVDERDQRLTPSRADALVARFQGARARPESLRDLAAELAEAGYRRATMLALDYAFALSPPTDEVLERAAATQLERGHTWLADYYVSRMRRRPLLPALIRRAPVSDP